jgi:hypothetical protein
VRARRPADREPAKTESQARARFVKYLQKSLSAVHPTAQWRTVKTGNVWVALTTPEVVPLKTSTGNRIYLRSTLLFHCDDHPEYRKEQKVVTEEYAHTLSADELLKDEICSWHWQPGSRPDPHLHVGSLGATGAPPKRHHLPTGRVAFEQVLKYAIDECGIQTALDRSEALAQIDESLRRFFAFRTWG